jgi:hypothetical protein
MSHDNDDDDKKLPDVAGRKNPFEAFADAANSSSIIGQLLKFSKGDWLVGRDGEDCQYDELAAVLSGMLHGWVRWQEAQPVEQHMGLLSEGYVPPDRASLGHTDRSQWQLNRDGQPRDPWARTIYLPMVSPDGEEVFTFPTNSEGGRRRCIAPLCREYGHHIRQRPDELPIVPLEQDSYPHPDRSIGRVKYPVFLPVKKWVAAEPFVNAVATAAGRPITSLEDN